MISINIYVETTMKQTKKKTKSYKSYLIYVCSMLHS